ncbi:MAG: hypothetical protein P4L84_12650 [Isosphaeraceae bacterium]|nr:hypothetical protein [Isosphaeraceae bacterium]
MADDPLKARIDRMIEELMTDPNGETAALASILMAVQSALRAGELTELALATWEFVDTRRPCRPGPRPKIDV